MTVIRYATDASIVNAGRHGFCYEVCSFLVLKLLAPVVQSQVLARAQVVQGLALLVLFYVLLLYF